MHFTALLMLLAAAPAPKTGAAEAPQMTLKGGAQSVACGDSVKVSLEGRFPADTKVQIRRDDVELADVNLTPTTLAATLKLAKTALPGPVTLEATSAGGRGALVVANVNEKLRLSLQFEDGWTAALNELQAGFYDVVWKKGETTRESHAQIAPIEGGLRINFQMSPEDQKRSAAPRARQPKEAWACLQAVLRGRDGQLQGSGHCTFREMPVTAKVECLGR